MNAPVNRAWDYLYRYEGIKVMAKIYVSLEFDGGDLTFSKEVDDHLTRSDRRLAFNLVMQAMATYLQAFTPEMREAAADLDRIRQLFIEHAAKKPAPKADAVVNIPKYCPSCQHLVKSHDERSCKHVATHVLPGDYAACPCALPHGGVPK